MQKFTRFNLKPFFIYSTITLGILFNNLNGFANTSSLSSMLGISSMLGMSRMSCDSLFDFIKQVPLDLHLQYVSVSQEIQSNRILFLTAAEYQKAIEESEIPIHSILVLDSMPLVEDIPLVEAVIISSPLKLEATHIQILAEKTGIALIYIDGAFNNVELRKLAKIGKSYSINCTGNTCLLGASEKTFAPKPQLKSVLPLSLDRDEKKLFNLNSDKLSGRAAREFSGDKYYELMGFKMAFPHLVPDISSLSTGFFEYFLTNYKVEDTSLRSLYNLLTSRLNKATEDNDEAKVKELLKTMRQNILTSNPAHNRASLFEEITNLLQNYYGKTEAIIDLPFAFRSNQETEDLIGAGLYKSSVARSLRVADIEQSLRKTWASLYNYHPYTIRRFWGQKEFNLSMPIMVHPFLHDVLSHSLGTFKWNSKSGLELEINMVLGDSEKATNPSANAEVVQFTVKTDSQGVAHIVYNLKSQVNGTAAIEQSILAFYSEVKDFVTNEFLLRTYTPTAVNVEFIVQKTKTPGGDPTIQVLQYKPNPSKEVVFDLLSGLLSRKQADQKKSEMNQLQDFPSLFNEIDMHYLDDYIPDIQPYSPYIDRPWRLRYALIIDNKIPSILIWDIPMDHKTLRDKIDRTKAKWLKSGYLRIEKNFTTKKPSLVFTGTPSQDTDVHMIFNVSHKLFQEAFDRAYHANPHFRKFITENPMPISFQTNENVGTVTVP